ncbi:MAG: SWIM zinc finger family protein [Candidatus Binatia bacterium]
MRATAAILTKVEDKRFQKAVEGLRNGYYHVVLTLRSEGEVRGFVKGGDDEHVYGCTITEAGAFCSCPDALYRGSVCKHAVALALHEIRNPPNSAPSE